MTGLNFSLTNNAAELARGKLQTYLGDTIVEFAQFGNANIDPLGAEGWDIAGRVTAFGESRTPEYFDLRTGSPETSKGMIITGDDLTYGFTLDHPTLLGWQFITGANLASTSNYAADGQTTVASGGSKTGAVVTSATGLAKGDMVEIDLGTGVNATYGSFKALAFITSISGTTVTYTRLPQSPANGADFKKIKGYPATSAAGVEFNIGGGQVRTMQMRLTTFSIPQRTLIIDYFKQVEIVNPAPITRDDRKSPLQIGFGAKCIPEYTSMTDLDGVSYEGYRLGRRILLPYES